MKRSDLTEFEVEEAGFKIKIKRNTVEASQGGGYSAHPFPTSPAEQLRAVQASQPVPAAPVESSKPIPTSGDEAGVVYVKSPMVGTFYRSPSPDSPPFADAGTKIEEKSVVCIIEAMKIMNEIQAEVKGTILEVLVENGQPVEYGQRLFKVKAN